MGKVSNISSKYRFEILTRCLDFGRNFHFTIFYFLRYNESGQIGGNAPLSHEGLGYADKLADFIYLQPESRRLKIFCSTLQRTIQTASPMAKKYKMNVMKWRALSEIEVGKFYFLIYSEEYTRLVLTTFTRHHDIFARPDEKVVDKIIVFVSHWRSEDTSLFFDKF